MPKESVQGEEIMATATTPARPPFPPFTRDSAVQKVRLAEDAWNTRNPAKVALAYTIERHGQFFERVERFTMEESIGIH